MASAGFLLFIIEAAERSMRSGFRISGAFRRPWSIRESFGSDKEGSP
jgi:hypothetical protein